MAYTNETVHYGFPLPLAADLTVPMDYNESLEAADTALFEAQTNAAGAVGTAGNALTVANEAKTEAQSATATANAATATAGAAATAANEAVAAVAEAKDDALDMICAVVETTATAQYKHDPTKDGANYYFRYNDILYKTTAVINVGETIVPNTNCAATNVATELGLSVGAVRFYNGNLQQFDGSTWINIDIGGASMPTLDFASPLHTFSSGNLTFTATKECYLAGSLTTVNNQVNTLSINGTNVASSYFNDTNGVSYINNIFYKLSAGDVVIITQASGPLHVFDVVS